jgi:hypothetical protein
MVLPPWMVFVEAAVLGGQHGRHQRRRHLFERHRDAVLLVERRDESILGVVDQRRLRAWVECESPGNRVDVLFDLPDRIHRDARGNPECDEQGAEQGAPDEQA